MRKSSRLWWLHGAILLTAALGCKSNSCCNNGGYGASPSGTPVMGGSPTGGSPYVSGGPTTYQSTTSGMPAGASMSGMSSAQPSFGPSSGGGFPMPSQSSSMSPSFGGGR